MEFSGFRLAQSSFLLVSAIRIWNLRRDAIIASDDAAPRMPRMQKRCISKYCNRKNASVKVVFPRVSRGTRNVFSRDMSLGAQGKDGITGANQ
jgi:hypothetical protein